MQVRFGTVAILPMQFELKSKSSAEWFQNRHYKIKSTIKRMEK